VDLQELGWESVDWINLAQDDTWQAAVKTIKTLYVLSKLIEFLYSIRKY
jgi:hypothetical protein